MTQWFYAKGDQKCGPIDTTELKRLAASGELNPTDLIWKEGFSDWIPALKARGLFTDQVSPNLNSVSDKSPSTAELELRDTDHWAKSVGRWASKLISESRKCRNCESPIGLLSTAVRCDSCEKKSQEERQLREIETRAELEARRIQEAKELHELALRKRQMAIEATASIKRQIAAGRSVVLHRSEYLEVDSTVVNRVPGHFDISPLRRLGLSGWRVIGVVPRTLGIALTNISAGSTYGETWGAGIGGNVVGVHVLLCLELRMGSFSENMLLDYVLDNFDEIEDVLSGDNGSDS